jgi:hypothetical protein
MAGFFKSPSFDDAVLGRLERSRGLWRGTLAVGGVERAPLALFGSNREPDAAALATARQIAPSFNAWRPTIEQALFDHYAPYAEAASEEEASAPSAAMPAIERPNQVWAHVSLQSVAVTKLSGVVTTELVYVAAWDDDHMLGARFQSGNFVELCGSVLPV